MYYQKDVEDLERLQENPSTKMKSTTMIIPTPSKIEITGKRSFSEIVEIENEDSEVKKRQNMDSEREMVEVGGKKMKEKDQGPVFQI